MVVPANVLKRYHNNVDGMITVFKEIDGRMIAISQTLTELRKTEHAKGKLDKCTLDNLKLLEESFVLSNSTQFQSNITDLTNLRDGWLVSKHFLASGPSVNGANLLAKFGITPSSTPADPRGLYRQLRIVVGRCINDILTSLRKSASTLTMMEARCTKSQNMTAHLTAFIDVLEKFLVTSSYSQRSLLFDIMKTFNNLRKIIGNLQHGGDPATLLGLQGMATSPGATALGTAAGLSGVTATPGATALGTAAGLGSASAGPSTTATAAVVAKTAASGSTLSTGIIVAIVFAGVAVVVMIIRAIYKKMKEKAEKAAEAAVAAGTVSAVGAANEIKDEGSNVLDGIGEFFSNLWEQFTGMFSDGGDGSAVTNGGGGGDTLKAARTVRELPKTPKDAAIAGMLTTLRKHHDYYDYHKCAHRLQELSVSEYYTTMHAIDDFVAHYPTLTDAEITTTVNRKAFLECTDPKFADLVKIINEDVINLMITYTKLSEMITKSSVHIPDDDQVSKHQNTKTFRSIIASINGFVFQNEELDSLIKGFLAKYSDFRNLVATIPTYLSNPPSGGTNKTHVKYDNKICKVMLDKELKMKYIRCKKTRIYLNTIRGKYRYV